MKFSKVVSSNAGKMETNTITEWCDFTVALMPVEINLTCYRLAESEFGLLGKNNAYLCKGK